MSMPADMTARSFAFADGSPLFRDNRIALEVDGRIGAPSQRIPSSDGAEMVFVFQGHAVSWHWRVRKHSDSRWLVKSFLRNAGGAVKLGRCVLLDSGDTALSGHPEHRISVLGHPYHGAYPFRHVDDVLDGKASGRSTIKLQFYDRTTGHALQVGFVTFQRILTRVHYESGSDTGLTRLVAACDFLGWELPAGAATDLEEFTIATGADPFAQLEAWADLAADRIRPVFRHKPALGFLGSAWVSSINNPGENKASIIQANLPAIAEKLKGFGIEYLWVSIANLSGGHPGNWREWNETNLPGGLDSLVREVERHGLKLGLWCGPFLLSSHLAELVEMLGDAILRDENGEPVVYLKTWAHGDSGKLPPEQRPSVYALDPTHPKTQAFLRHALEHYREHGVRYYMMDFIEAAAGPLCRCNHRGYANKARVPGPDALLAGMRLIREIVGPDTFILSSTGPTLHLSGTVDAVRVGNDFGEGRAIAPKSNFYPASFVINGSFTAAATALTCAAANYYTHNKLYLNDSGNVLTVDKPIPLESARIHATIHALSGASSMLGDDLRYITPDRLRLIKQTLPRSIHVARPLDLFTRPAPQSPTLFHRHIVRAWEDYHVVAVYNLSDAPETREIAFEAFGLASDRPCHVWEFWGEAYQGRFRTTMSASIPPESVRVFRITPERDMPQIIGTDMHILMGECEIASCLWDAGERRIEVEAVRPAAEEGSVFLRMPQTMHGININDCYIARNRDGRQGELILRLHFTFTDANPVKTRICFGLTEN